MADTSANEESQIETAASTPASSHADQANGLKSAKDRSCPFCGQAFTSSSLGRHLDLYIKPRNPKPADGVHDVEEIKKMRGGITRRQPKANLKPGANINASGWRKDGDSDEGTHTGASRTRTGSMDGIRFVERRDLAARVSEDRSELINPNPMREYQDPVQVAINAPNWQATGVINNLPPRRDSPTGKPNPDFAQPNSMPALTNTGTAQAKGQLQRLQQMREDSAGNRVQRPDYESMPAQKLQEAAEVGRAAELALREVLGSLEAAKAKAESSQLFEDVDFFSLSFPALCLAILPAPSALFSSTPFPAGDSWTLQPPGQKQFESLNRVLGHRIQSARTVTPQNWLDTDVFRHNVHLQSAYEHWCRMSGPQQSEAWTLETLRSLSRAKEERSQTRLELDASQNRVRHLETEYDRLSRCQLPREYLLHPPNTMPAPAALVKEMEHASHHLYAKAASDVNYDVDALLSKWRTAVKATQRKPQTTYSNSTTTPAPDLNDKAVAGGRSGGARTDILDYERNTQNSTDQMSGDIIMQGAIFGVNGAMPRTKPGDDPHGTCSDPQTVASWDYETPENPGAVVEVDGEVENGTADGEEEAQEDDAEGETDDGPSGLGGYGNGMAGANQHALVKQTRSSGFRDMVNLPNGLNRNGKRGWAPTPTDGRDDGAKFARERWK